MTVVEQVGRLVRETRERGERYGEVVSHVVADASVCRALRAELGTAPLVVEGVEVRRSSGIYDFAHVEVHYQPQNDWSETYAFRTIKLPGGRR